MAGGDEPFDAVEIESQLRIANDYFIDTFDPTTLQHPWWWDRATYYVGNVELGKLIDENRYWQHAHTWAEHNSWNSGIFSNRWRHPLHADALLAHQIYMELHVREPAAHKIAAALARMDDLLSNRAWTDTGGTDPNNSIDDWWWIDAYFMAGATLAKAAHLQSKDAYLAQLRAMFEYMRTTRGLFSEVHGLWFRDENQLPHLRLSPNGEPMFWSRGNGWVFAGHTRVLDELDHDHPDREIYLSNFIKMAHALAQLQQADGFWRSNLLDPQHYAGPETSGTAFFVAGIAWGIRNGYLDDQVFLPVLEFGWTALSTIALRPNGRVGYVQAIGLDPQLAAPDETHDFGVGAFLLAGTEMLKLIGGPAAVYPYAGPDRMVVVDGNTVQYPFAVNIDSSIVRSGDIVSATWWTGDTFLADGFRTTIDLPHGSHDITLRLQMDDGQSYQNQHTLTLQVGTPDIKSISASTWQHPNTPANSMDDNLATRWSAEGIGQWIQYEFGEPRTIDSASIAFYLGNERRSHFQILASTDAQTWVTALGPTSSSGTTLDLESFHFAALEGIQFIRIVGNGNSSNNWNSITEVTIGSTALEWDSDSNGLPDAWEIHRFGALGQDPHTDANRSGITNLGEYIIGSDPVRPRNSDPANFTIRRNAHSGELELAFFATAAFGPGYPNHRRNFTIEFADSLHHASWQPLGEIAPVQGDNRLHQITLPQSAQHGNRFFRLIITLEER